MRDLGSLTGSGQGPPHFELQFPWSGLYFSGVIPCFSYDINQLFSDKLMGDGVHYVNKLTF